MSGRQGQKLLLRNASRNVYINDRKEQKKCLVNQFMLSSYYFWMVIFLSCFLQLYQCPLFPVDNATTLFKTSTKLFLMGHFSVVISCFSSSGFSIKWLALSLLCYDLLPFVIMSTIDLSYLKKKKKTLQCVILLIAKLSIYAVFDSLLQTFGISNTWERSKFVVQCFFFYIIIKRFIKKLLLANQRMASSS